MGADNTAYLVFGFKLKKNGINIHDDKLLPYTEGYRGIIDILTTDTTGNHIIFGRRLSQLDFEEERITYIEYQNIPLTGETHRLTELFIQLFGQNAYDSLENKEPQLMHFNHLS